MRHRTCRPLDLPPAGTRWVRQPPTDARVLSTYTVVRHLVDEGFARPHKWVFTEPDVVTETSVDREGRMYSADLGAALPTDTADLEPAVWRPAHKNIALLTGRVDEQGEA
jgi:hypothetical protein